MSFQIYLVKDRSILYKYIYSIWYEILLWFEPRDLANKEQPSSCPLKKRRKKMICTKLTALMHTPVIKSLSIERSRTSDIQSKSLVVPGSN